MRFTALAEPLANLTAKNVRRHGTLSRCAGRKSKGNGTESDTGVAGMRTAARTLVILEQAAARNDSKPAPAANSAVKYAVGERSGGNQQLQQPPRCLTTTPDCSS